MRITTIYLRHTDQDGGSNVQEHTCWDAERFIASQEREYAKHGTKVERATREDHRTSTWAKKH